MRLRLTTPLAHDINTPMDNTESNDIQQAIDLTGRAMLAIQVALDNDDGVGFLMMAEGVRDVWDNLASAAKEVMEL